MAECYRCPYTTRVERKYGFTTHCDLEPTKMDVTYYCMNENKDKNNSLCPFVYPRTRIPGIDYTKYETDFLTAKKERRITWQ